MYVSQTFNCGTMWPHAVLSVASRRSRLLNSKNASRALCMLFPKINWASLSYILCSICIYNEKNENTKKEKKTAQQHWPELNVNLIKIWKERICAFKCYSICEMCTTNRHRDKTFNVRRNTWKAHNKSIYKGTYSLYTYNAISDI